MEPNPFHSVAPCGSGRYGSLDLWLRVIAKVPLRLLLVPPASTDGKSSNNRHKHQGMIAS